MQLGIVGLGRMGRNIALRLIRGGHEVFVFNREGHHVAELEQQGARGAKSLEDLVAKLAPPRAVWIMLPAGGPTEAAVQGVGGLMKPGDAVIDGGNSRFRDDLRRAAALAPKGVRYLDVGTSGGIWGRERGYCLMIGGDEATVKRLSPIFATLAPGKAAAPPTPGRTAGGTAEEGYLHCGPVGSGHFVKMIHNGIEYGLMQAYAEGFDILRGAASAELPADERFSFDLGAIAEVWRRGSVVQSWLLDLTSSALAEDPSLSRFEGAVPDSGEGRWTLEAAIASGVPAESLANALFARFRSRRAHTFGEKVLSAMRAKFGGHVEAAPEGR